MSHHTPVLTFFIAIFLSATFTQATKTQSISSADARSSPNQDFALLSAMDKEKIVPDIIDAAPKTVLEVKYGDIQVDSGNLLSPGQVEKQPEVKWQAETDKFYLLIMIDPDAPLPSHPIMSQIRHWMIGNIKGSDISTGDVINEYAGAGPPPGSPPHRYIFFVYQQPDKIAYSEKPEDSRRKFKLRDFVKKYNLGDPVAGNFFLAKWDEGFLKFAGKMWGQLTGKTQ